MLFLALTLPLCFCSFSSTRAKSPTRFQESTFFSPTLSLHTRDLGARRHSLNFFSQLTHSRKLPQRREDSLAHSRKRITHSHKARRLAHSLTQGNGRAKTDARRLFTGKRTCEDRRTKTLHSLARSRKLTRSRKLNDVRTKTHSRKLAHEDSRTHSKHYCSTHTFTKTHSLTKNHTRSLSSRLTGTRGDYSCVDSRRLFIPGRAMNCRPTCTTVVQIAFLFSLRMGHFTRLLDE